MNHLANLRRKISVNDEEQRRVYLGKQALIKRYHDENGKPIFKVDHDIDQSLDVKRMDVVSKACSSSGRNKAKNVRHFRFKHQMYQSPDLPILHKSTPHLDNTSSDMASEEMAKLEHLFYDRSSPLPKLGSCSSDYGNFSSQF
ncbi:uncharacterized protein LOC141856355 [Brevipalpus obovatus]|uniref:uncharacterized protein LOC141856355 n=1 Tax=Brevipalpus obovatus TaxID=246614 RepID=UPI003D9DEE43